MRVCKTLSRLIQQEHGKYRKILAIMSMNLIVERSHLWKIPYSTVVANKWVSR